MTRAAGPSLRPAWPPRRQDLAAAGLLLLATLPWWLALRLPFIGTDDPYYVTENSDVLAGLTPGSVAAAFSSAWGGLWSPVTFLSLMLDITVFGPWSVGLHATNVVLHIANAILVYLFLRRATGAWGRSLAVAVLFAMHPLRVESVAWVSERKDVLAMFFLMLALLAYLAMARAAGRRAVACGAALCGLYALSLMSKPMAVTLPALLFILDGWPLGRLTGPGKVPWRRLVLEKVPVAVLAVAISVVTLVVQRELHVTEDLGRTPPLLRLQTAAVGYALYLRDHVYFEGLALYYPLVRELHVGAFAAAAALLAGLTALAVYAARRPGLGGRGRAVLAGWAWFVLTLLPMIGLVQSGAQSRADRYTYFPSVGLLTAAVWLWPAAWVARPRGRWLAAATAGGCACLLAVHTTYRLRLWADPLAMYMEGLAHTGPNGFLESAIGVMLQESKNYAGALEYYDRAVRSSPWLPSAHHNRAAMLMRFGRTDEGLREFDAARRLAPWEPLYDLSYRRALQAIQAASRPR
jgi:tetratricopeptide (TPR) repeat protein